MGDVRFQRILEDIRDLEDPAAEIRGLADDAIVQALGGLAAEERDERARYLANVLATEAMNRLERARVIARHLGEGVYVVDETQRVLHLNPEAERIVGWTLDELRGQDMHRTVHFQRLDGSPVEKADCAVWRCLRTREVARSHDDLEAFTRKDGTRFAVSFTAAPVVRDDELVGAAVVFRDVTEEQRARAALVASEARYRGLFHSVRDAILVADVTRGIVDANPAFEEMTGYTVDEARGRTTRFLYATDADYEGVGRVIRENWGRESPTVLTATWRRKDGALFAAEISASYLRGDEGSVLGFIGVVRDVTAARRAEAALRESERRLARIVEALPEGVLVVDAAGRVTLANAAAERLLGMPRDRLVDRSFDEPDWRASTPDGTHVPNDRLPLARALRDGETVENAELVVPRAAGPPLRLGVSATPLTDPATGEAVGAVASFTDVSRERRAESMLHEAEQRFRVALDRLREGAFSLDAGGTVTAVNAAAVALVGHAVEDVLGHPFEPLVAPEHRARSQGLFYRVVAERGVVTDEPLALLHRDGARVPVRVTASPTWVGGQVAGAWGFLEPEGDAAGDAGARAHE